MSSAMRHMVSGSAKAAVRILSSTSAPSFAVACSAVLQWRKIADGSDAGRKKFYFSSKEVGWQTIGFAPWSHMRHSVNSIAVTASYNPCIAIKASSPGCPTATKSSFHSSSTTSLSTPSQEDKMSREDGRALARDVFIYDLRDLNTLLGGLVLTAGVTDANFYAMVDIIIDILLPGPFFLQNENSGTIAQDAQPLLPGRYFVVADGTVQVCFFLLCELLAQSPEGIFMRS